MIKRNFLALVAFALTLIAQSQTSDFGIWYETKAVVEMTPVLDFSISADVRTFESASKVDEGFGEVGLKLRVLSGLSVAGYYRLTSVLEDNGNYYLRHKLMGDLLGSFDAGRFTFSGRFRFQRQAKTYFENADDEIPDYYGRIRLKTEYDIKSLPLTPYVSWETYARMFEQSAKRFEKFRYSAGLEYKLNKKHSFEAGYMFQKDYIPKVKSIHVLVLGYTINIK